MGKRRNYWLYGLMLSTAFWVLTFSTYMLIEGFDVDWLLPRLLLGLAISAVGTFLVGGMEMWRHRSDTDLATLWNSWLVGLVQSVAAGLLVVAVLLHDMRGVSAGVWISAAAFMLGAGTLVFGNIERWRRRNLKP